MNIFNLIKTNSMKEIKKNIDSFDLNELNEDGYSPLHLAVMRRNIELVDFLLDYVDNVDVKAKDGTTPLHLAVLADDYNLVELLLQYGGDSESKDKKNRTPIYLAGQNSKHAVYELLSNWN